MVLKNLYNKKTGKKVKNIEVVKEVYDTLNDMINIDSEDPVEHAKAIANADTICGGSGNTQRVLDWCKQVLDCKNERDANDMINRTLLAPYSKED